MMDGQIKKMLDKAMHAHAEYERQWWKQDRRGRWVVLEPGPGRLLKDSPRRIRDRVDALVSQRGRRFSSLSRARAFAREVGGAVRRWRHQMPKRGPWTYQTNPWKRVAQQTPLLGLCPDITTAP